MKLSVPDWEIMSEIHDKRVGSFFPRGSFRAWDLALPSHKISSAIILVLNGLSDKAKGVVASPVFPLLFKSVDDKLIDVLSVHEKLGYFWNNNNK